MTPQGEGPYHVRVTVAAHLLVDDPEEAISRVSDSRGSVLGDILQADGLWLNEDSLRLEYLHGGTWVPARVADAL